MIEGPGSATFRRDRFTWLAYLLLAFYAYFLNSLGPITPFLKEELDLSYTISGFHFTAFAVGTLIIGLAGGAVVGRVGQERALWLGAFGVSVSVAVLLTVRSVALTIGASFCMGLVGSLILVTVPALLSQLHGESRAVAISEANMTASLVGAAAPLLVGWAAAAALPGGWRWALGVVALAPFLARPLFGRAGSRRLPPASADLGSARRTLPGLYWLYWVALFLAVAVEFCMIFWSASYLISLGMKKAGAAEAVGLFLAGMVIGRLVASRLVRRFSSHGIVVASILVAGLGFGIFWAVAEILPALVGLFVTGLGVAGLYPLLVSLALGVAHDPVRASARAALASATAILALPLALGRLADAIGIRPAYGLVAFLLAAVLVIVLFTRRLARSRVRL